MIAYNAVQIEEFYPAKLKKALEQHNGELSALNARAAAIPDRKAALARAVQAGQIAGVDAATELRAIGVDLIATTIELFRLLQKRPAFDGERNVAFKAEGDRLSKLASDRAAEITKQIGSLLAPADVGKAITCDGTWRTYSEKMHHCKQVQICRSKGAHDESAFSADYIREMVAVFGKG